MTAAVILSIALAPFVISSERSESRNLGSKIEISPLRASHGRDDSSFVISSEALRTAVDMTKQLRQFNMQYFSAL